MSDRPARKPTARKPRSTDRRAADPAILPVAAHVPAPVAAPVPPVAEAIVVEAASAIEDSVNSVTETIAPAAAPAASATKETIMEATTKAKAAFTDVSERAKAAFSKGQNLFAEMNEFNKGNVEALVESGKIAATGLQSMAQDSAEFGRKSFEQASSAFKGMAQVKSPTELAKLHTDYVRGMFDAMVAETSRNTEAMLKLAGEVAQPISNRFAVAAEKVKLAA